MSSMMHRSLGDLSQFGESLWAWIASMNAWVAALFVLAFAVDRLLASRVSAAWRVLLYVPILVRLLVPGAWVITIPVAVSPTAVAVAPEVVTSAAPATPALGVGVSEPRLVLSWTALLPLAYAAGAALLALRWRRERRRLQEILGASSDPPAWLRGLGRSFDIVEHPSAGPLLIGTRWPRLVLPRGLSDRIGEGGIRAVVAHEASHVRRGDPLFAAALHVLVILFWPIVAVWCGASRVRTLLEIACDERALRSADAATRRSYGEALIELASTRSRSIVALGFGDSLRERIVSLAAGERRWPAMGQALAALFTCAIIAACGSATVERRADDRVDGRADESPSPSAADTRVLDLVLLRKPLLGGGGEPAMVRTVELDRLLLANAEVIVSRPVLMTRIGETAVLKMADDAPNGTGRTLEIEAKVVDDRDGVRTIELRFSEKGAETSSLRGEAMTLKLADGSSIEMGVKGTEAKSLMLTVRPVNEPGRPIPILKDLPLLAIDAKPAPESKPHDPLNGEYPQVMCMMNLIEVDGPIYFSKDNVIEQGRNDGTAHRVQAGDLTTKTFDWFQRLKGYVNLSAPAILVRPGEDGSIRVGATDKSGASVGGNDVTVRFVERDGALRADVRWRVGDGKGEFVEAYHATDVRIDASGAMLVILPTVAEKPGVGRILMVRPSLIRGVEEYPFQRGN
jgi:beta-lactamase regulating signal transducer with metallopeptidase domain